LWADGEVGHRSLSQKESVAAQDFIDLARKLNDAAVPKSRRMGQ